MKAAGMTARILTMTTENKIDRDNESDAYNLLPSSLEKILPKLYATENIPKSLSNIFLTATTQTPV